MKIRITQAAVDRMRPPAEGRNEYFDSHLPGFGLRVSASGARSWFVFARLGKRLRRFTVGTVERFPKVDEARDAARELLREVGKGIDPTAAKKAAAAEAITVGALAADFIERYAKRNRSWESTRAQLRDHVLSEWGDRPAASIARRDVHALLDGLAAQGHAVLPNRVLSTVRKMFGWAVEKDILPASPAAGVKAPAKETTRDRVLSDAELRTVWEAAEGLGAPARAFVRLLALTGMRRDEAAKARWSDVDFAASTWTVPAAANKTGKVKVIPMTSLAISVLPPRGAGPYVFSTTGGRVPLSGYSKMKARLDRLAPMPPWTLHDLRRTAASRMDELEVPIATIGLVLGHAPTGVTSKSYIRSDHLKQKRAALQLWSDRVAKIIGAQIITLHDPAKRAVA